jgi:hypothetical protein
MYMIILSHLRFYVQPGAGFRQPLDLNKGKSGAGGELLSKPDK